MTREEVIGLVAKNMRFYAGISSHTERDAVLDVLNDHIQVDAPCVADAVLAMYDGEMEGDWAEELAQAIEIDADLVEEGAK